MKLRELAAPLEAALERMQARAEAARPCVVVECGTNTSVFVQYYGGFGTPIMLEVCLNHDTREIPDFETRAEAFFRRPARFCASEPFGRWTQECASLTIAVELGMLAFRHLLAVDWATELSIDELAQSLPRAN